MTISQEKVIPLIVSLIENEKLSPSGFANVETAVRACLRAGEVEQGSGKRIFAVATLQTKRSYGDLKTIHGLGFWAAQNEDEARGIAIKHSMVLNSDAQLNSEITKEVPPLTQ